MSASDLPGFADPVADAQSCFRALLDALARPGTRHRAGAGLSPPAPLAPATAAVLLTLVDGNTPLWLDEAVAPAWDWIAFHCGAVRAAKPDSAAFACALAMPDLAALPSGSDTEPEQSATVIVQRPTLEEGRVFRLSGPGLHAPARLRLGDLPGDFAARWAANHALYPRGVDLVLCAGTELCAVPRSTSIEEA